MESPVPPCPNCGRGVDKEDLYCPYCANKNPEFSLHALNEAFEIIPIDSFKACYSLDEVQNCDSRDPNHGFFRGRRSQDNPSGPLSRFCTLCGRAIASEKEILRRWKRGINSVYL